MRCNKDSILPSAFVSIIFLYACAFGSLVPLSARYDLEAFHYGRRSIFQGFYKRADSVLDQRSLDPPVPTVELCKGQLSVAKDKAVFYSSAVEESAKAYAASIGKVIRSIYGLFPTILTTSEQEAKRYGRRA